MTWRPLDGTTDITRRRLLVGLTAAGAAGALTGVGTAALLRDQGRFQENLLRAGAFDLAVDVDCEDVPCTSDTNVLTVDLGALTPGMNVVEFSLVLPEDSEANPGCPWMRLGCPETNDPRVLDAVTATLTHVQSDVDIFSATLRALAVDDEYQSLRNGVPFSAYLCDPTGPEYQTCVDDTCLAPGEPVAFRLTWEFDEELAGADETDLVASYHFGAVQKRHTTLPGDSPFDITEDVRCAYEDERYAISYVAFCSEDGLAPEDVELTVRQYEVSEGDGGLKYEPTIVDWALSEDAVTAGKSVSGVTIKFGKHDEYPSDVAVFPGGDSGTVYVGGGKLLVPSPNSEEFKQEYGSFRDVFGYNFNSFPCVTADGTPTNDGSFVKFETWVWEDGAVVGYTEAGA